MCWRPVSNDEVDDQSDADDYDDGTNSKTHVYNCQQTYTRGTVTTRVLHVCSETQ